MLLSQAIRVFLIATEADGASADTLKWYTSILKTFTEWLGEDRNLEAITTENIRLYIIWCRGEYSPDAAHGHIRVQHRFWRWCGLEYQLTSPMRNIKYPDQPKQDAPKSVTSNDVVKLFQAIPDTPIGKRDRALFMMLLDTGCRATGICTLKMVNLDVPNRRAIVTEKGRKTRELHFSDYTAAVLNEWIKIRANVPSVFYNAKTLAPLTRSGLEQILKRLKKVAGITGRSNPHAFRHFFAAEYLRNGGDLSSLSDILGHASIDITDKYYVRFTENQLHAQHEKYTPVHNFLKSLDKGEGGE